MRRILAAIGVLACGLAVSGCVAVTAKNNRWANELEAVAVDNQIYLVNVRTGQVATVDKSNPVPLATIQRDPHEGCD